MILHIQFPRKGGIGGLAVRFKVGYEAHRFIPPYYFAVPPLSSPWRLHGEFLIASDDTPVRINIPGRYPKAAWLWRIALILNGWGHPLLYDNLHRHS